MIFKAVTKTHRRVALAQVGIGALVTASAYLYGGWAVAAAATFGSLTALANTVLLAWRLGAAEKRGPRPAHEEATTIYRSALERFVVVLLLLAAGLGWVKLQPGPFLAGFVLGQLVLLSAPIITGIEKQ